MARPRTYDDEQLAAAIAATNSWRGVLRELGLSARSSGVMRSMRSRADCLGIDYEHFPGQRSWSESDLRCAIDACATWHEVLEKLGVRDKLRINTIKGHAARLKIDISHLTSGVPDDVEPELRPDMSRLGRASPLLAAAWFTLCGHDVSWPLEPSRYDLLVTTTTGIRRVQVKSTTVRAAATWKVYLSTSRGTRKTYGPDEIDDFFIVDGDLSYYLIPVSVVGGLQAIHLSAYEQFRLAQMS